MDIEAVPIASDARRYSWITLLTLAYQSFGVVYGDLSTSPLYVYTSTFSGRAKLSDDDAEIFGVLSLVFWTFTLLPLVKYVLIVLRADDNGEGGTFALYSLLCRHAKLSLLPNHQTIDEELSTYKLEPSNDAHCSAVTVLFEMHENLRTVLLVLVLLGTSMVIGDGILTPTISVLSAVSGIRVEADNLDERWVVLLACIILVGLFALQHYGTHRVGFMFAPIVIAWLFCIGSIGAYNIAYWNPGIVKALSPYYTYNFFKNTGKNGWLSLGGIVLCITGSEAMFADLGHFSRLPIKLAFLSAIYPSLILSYMGQAAFLSKNRESIRHSFYKSTPRPVFWPVFVVATCASIVGSQAVISATFSIIKQCQSLGCFPRVKVVHTSKHIHGQVYIPEINWILMVLCLAVTVGFKDTAIIGNAYGLAVITVMLVTTFLMSLVMVVVWQKSILVAVGFLLFFGSIECLYISACLIKVPQGGWAPLVFALAFMAVMYIWHYGVRKKYEFDMHNKVSMKWLLTLGPSLGIVRVRGIGLIYTELVTGVPPIFSHFVTNIPAFHQILVFVCIKFVPVAYVPFDERFLVGRIGPREYRMYRCIVRYGYKDIHKDDNDFENQLVLNIRNFIQTEEANLRAACNSHISCHEKMNVVDPSRGVLLEGSEVSEGLHSPQPSFGKLNTPQSQDPKSNSSSVIRRKNVRFELPSSTDVDLAAVREELTDLIEAKEAGIAYILGHSHVLAKKDSSLLKRLAINVVYKFLRKNCRGTSVALSIPHMCLIEVGMVYSV